MSKFKIVMLSITGFVLLCVLVISLGFAQLGWMKFFNPRKANIEREVFEETKSYAHGKIQDLAKYYEEYQKAESIEDKQTIEGLIKMNFADFEAENIKPLALRQFLINIRGF